jgi:PAS domain S-box-containing protein
MASKRPSNEDLRQRLSVYEGIVGALGEDRAAAATDAVEKALLQVRVMEENLRQTEERYSALVSNMSEGFAIHETVLDESGAPCDYRFLEINEAFERLAGLSRENVIGRTLTEVIADAEPFWVETYGKVTLSGEPARFEHYSASLERRYEVYAYRASPDHVAAIFTDVTERRRMDDVLRKRAGDLASARADADAERRRLDAVMEALPVGIAIVDEKGGVISANTAFDAIWGGTRPDVECVEDYGPYHAWWADTGKRIEPEEWASAQAIQHGKRVEGQLLEIQRFDGTHSFIINSAAPIRDADGRVIGGAVAIRDITRMQRVENAMRASEERFNLALLGTQEGVWDWDIETGSVYYSPRWKEMLGYSESEVEPDASALERLIHPDDQARVRELVNAILRGERQYRIEFRILHKDGHYLDILSQGFAVRSEDDGRITRIVGTHLDLTEQKTKERQIARLSSLYSVLSRVNEAIVRIHEEAGLFTEVCRIIAEEGRFPLVWIGKVKGHLVVPIASCGPERGYLDEIRVELDGRLGGGPTGTCIRENRSIVNDDFSANEHVSPWRKQAERHGFLASAAFPLCRGGLPVGALTLYSSEREALDEEQVLLFESLSADLSYALDALEEEKLRLRAEEALIEAKNELEDRVRERTRELEELNVELETRAHELRMLASELTLAEERERRRLAQVLHDNLQQLLVAARLRVESLGKRVEAEALRFEAAQIMELIGQSIAASRLLTVELSPPVLYEAGLVAGLNWLSGWMKDKHGLEVEVDAKEPMGTLPEELHLLVFRAVRELLFNVVKHAGVDRAKVTVERSGEGTVRLVVEDEGRGLKPRAVAPETSATSFGLSSIRQRLSLFDGNMEIESGPDRGTKVTVTVPIGPQAAQEVTLPLSEAASEAAGMRNTTAAIRVLVADDHEVMRKGLVGILEQQHGIEIVGEACNGRQALEEVRRLKPDVVIMDVSMPGINGIDSTRVIKTEMPDVRVVGLSMHSEDAVSERMLAAGAECHLSKDSPIQDLLAAIRGASE